MCALAASCAGGPGNKAEKQPVFEVQELFDSTRIPTITVARDGTVLAFAQGCRVVRRSEDNGKTWSPAREVARTGRTGGRTGACHLAQAEVAAAQQDMAALCISRIGSGRGRAAGTEFLRRGNGGLDLVSDHLFLAVALSRRCLHAACDGGDVDFFRARALEHAGALAGRGAGGQDVIDEKHGLPRDRSRAPHDERALDVCPPAGE